MSVSAFCMLRRCRLAPNEAVPQDRCPHPKEWCDCRCHPENEDDDLEAEVQRLENSRSPAAQVMGSVIARAERLPPHDEPRTREVVEVVNPRANARRPYQPGQVECPRDGCNRTIPADGPGRASHFRMHDRMDRPRETPPNAASQGGLPTETITVGPVTQTAEQIAAEGRTRPYGVALPAEQMKPDPIDQVRALLAERLGELDAERARVQAALDALNA